MVTRFKNTKKRSRTSTKRGLAHIWPKKLTDEGVYVSNFDKILGHEFPDLKVWHLSRCFVGMSQNFNSIVMKCDELSSCISGERGRREQGGSH